MDLFRRVHGLELGEHLHKPIASSAARRVGHLDRRPAPLAPPHGLELGGEAEVLEELELAPLEADVVAGRVQDEIVLLRVEEVEEVFDGRAAVVEACLDASVA